MKLHSKQSGYTLIELMVTVGIIGILAALAIPTYSDYTTRSKVSEGLQMASVQQALVADAWQSAGASGVTSAADAIGAFVPSKYVECITVNDASGNPQGSCTTGAGDTGAAGMITVVFNDTALSGLTPTTNKIHITPSVGGNVLSSAAAATSNGAVDWGCASQSGSTASSAGLPVSTGTLLARFAPSQCK
jgi:type IV pilus assembly protein PilA